ncbi:head-tail connector protein [Clostridium estertheticum]|uniref:head-tail connector protein n=1 Tax=Clostridium estertheticum TaxID=238834 RepID=UPI001C0E1726|nr:head-tail connector protein [Clostridium estertheticum]MBU3216652.1 head-tail connector protein [Clostridium estertheticum]MCB2340896.1 head-tail connector protein [Clostridium estertheticum]WAG54393.1 head-tail connector protein [Clostridium estertheticum]
MDLEFIKTYLKIDGDEEDEYLQDLIDVSLIYIDFMVSENYKQDLKAVKLAGLLQRKLIADMHENKTTIISTNTKADRIVLSILDKLSNYEDVVI